MRSFRTCLLLAALGYLGSGLGALAAPAPEVAPNDIKQASMQSVENLVARRFALLEQTATDASRGPALEATLAKLADGLPSEAPKSIRLIAYRTQVNDVGPKSYFITYEFEFSQRWALIRLEWQRVDGKLRLNGFNIELTAVPVERVNAFTFNGKGLINYLVVCLAVIGPLLKVYALVRCLLAKALKWKLLWLAFILVGLGTFSVNWTTGDSRLSFLTFDFLGASIVRSGYGPWVVSVSLPLGALVFLFKLRRMRRRKLAASPAAPLS
jgi:hypothetical protein